jgi:hypothetical protein
MSNLNYDQKVIQDVVPNYELNNHAKQNISIGHLDAKWRKNQANLATDAVLQSSSFNYTSLQPLSSRRKRTVSIGAVGLYLAYWFTRIEMRYGKPAINSFRNLPKKIMASFAGLLSIFSISNINSPFHVFSRGYTVEDGLDKRIDVKTDHLPEKLAAPILLALASLFVLFILWNSYIGFLGHGSSGSNSPVYGANSSSKSIASGLSKKSHNSSSSASNSSTGTSKNATLISNGSTTQPGDSAISGGGSTSSGGGSTTTGSGSGSTITIPGVNQPLPVTVPPITVTDPTTGKTLISTSPITVTLN